MRKEFGNYLINPVVMLSTTNMLNMTTIHIQATPYNFIRSEMHSFKNN